MLLLLGGAVPATLRQEQHGSSAEPEEKEGRSKQVDGQSSGLELR